MPAPCPALHLHRGRGGDPLYLAHRTLHTGEELLIDRQRERLRAVFAADAHAHVEATWGVGQRMSTTHRDTDRFRGRATPTTLIESLPTGGPEALTELTILGRTLTKRAADVLAYFDRPGTSNDPKGPVNGQLEHLRGTALGFRNLTHYIARSLLETGGFKVQEAR